MSDDGEKAVRLPPFSGKKEDWDKWSKKFVTRAMIKKYKDVLLGTAVPPPHNKVLDLSTASGKASQKLREANEKAYSDLMILCEDDVSFSIIDAARPDDQPEGDAAKAWRGLLAKYEPSTASERVRLDREFTRSVLKNGSDDPDVWLTDLERKRYRLKQLKVVKTDDDIIRHVLNNLPAEYDGTVEHLEYLMTKNELSIEVLRDTLNSRYEKLCIREHRDTDTNEEAALTAGSFNKPFKHSCRLCGRMGHKAEDCWGDIIMAMGCSGYGVAMRYSTSAVSSVLSVVVSGDDLWSLTSLHQ